MKNIYYTIKLATTPFKVTGNIIEKFAGALSIIPSAAVIIFLVASFIHMGYKGMFNLICFGLLYAFIGGIIIAVVNMGVALIMSALSGVCAASSFINQWASEKEIKAADKSKNMHSIQRSEDISSEPSYEEFYKKIFEDDDFGTCYDPAYKE